MASIQEIISQLSQRNGIDPYVPLTIAYAESSFNPGAVGDGGSSFGLFQLHRGGLAPDDKSDSQLKDPTTNATIAIPHMKTKYDEGRSKGLAGFDLVKYVANNSGWPGSLGTTWTDNNTAYNKRLQTAWNEVGSKNTGGGLAPTAGNLGNLGDLIHLPDFNNMNGSDKTKLAVYGIVAVGLLALMGR